MNTRAFGCYNQDDCVRKYSSSGGIYTLIAVQTIRAGGIVYAACWDNQHYVEHRALRTEEEIKQSCGAKYISSRIGDVFQQVFDHLDRKVRVMFVGLPCQCEGLLNYLTQKKADLQLLTVVDMICHGVTGEKTWRMYLKEEESSKRAQLVSINMRDKTNGWTGYGWKLDFSNGISEVRHHDQNIYMRGYKNDLFLRPACYQCPFKGIERKTDLTLGDLWGGDHLAPDLCADNKGTSLVLIHSEKGMSLFEAMKDQLNWQAVDALCAAKLNPSIVEATKMPDKRARFLNELNKKGNFHTTVRKFTRDPIKIRVYHISIGIKMKIKSLFQGK